MAEAPKLGALDDDDDDGNGGGGGGGSGGGEENRSDLEMLLPENLVHVDRVMDFLLNLRVGGRFVQMNSVHQKLETCRRPGSKDFRADLQFNENVMVRLLETDYFERLLKRAHARSADAGSRRRRGAKGNGTLTYLIKFILSYKDHSPELVRACCRKIQSVSRLEYADALIDPLVSLAQHGHVYNRTWAMQALRSLATTPEMCSTLVDYDSGAVVPMAVGMVFSERSTEMLVAALSFLVTAFEGVGRRVARKREMDPTMSNPLLDNADFTARLVDMLRPRLETKDTRMHEAVLAEAADLLLRMVPDQRARQRILAADGVAHLMAIVDLSADYSRIMVKVTACIGAIYYHARNDIAEMGDASGMGAVEGQATTYALIVTRALSRTASNDDLQVCLNLLIIIRYLVKFTGARTMKDGQDRIDVLQQLFKGGSKSGGDSGAGDGGSSLAAKLGLAASKSGNGGGGRSVEKQGSESLGGVFRKVEQREREWEAEAALMENETESNTRQNKKGGKGGGADKAANSWRKKEAERKLHVARNVRKNRELLEKFRAAAEQAGWRFNRTWLKD